MTTIQNRERRVFSLGILRLAGYGLLLTAVVNICLPRISPEWTNPLWEFQTTGAIIEIIPVILLGIILVCYGQRRDRAPIEATILRGLSWLSLVLAILLLLFIPLNIGNSFRIYARSHVITNPQFVSQNNIIQQFRQQLEVANSKAEIGKILQQQIQQIDIPDSVDTAQLKTSILNDLPNNWDSLTSQTLAFRAQQRSMLLKKCVRWNLGALIASILFFLIWRSTGWTKLAHK